MGLTKVFRHLCDFAGNVLANAATPVASTDVANKAYVDAMDLKDWQKARASGLTTSSGTFATMTGLSINTKNMALATSYDIVFFGTFENNASLGSTNQIRFNNAGGTDTIITFHMDGLSTKTIPLSWKWVVANSGGVAFIRVEWNTSAGTLTCLNADFSIRGIKTSTIL